MMIDCTAFGSITVSTTSGDVVKRKKKASEKYYGTSHVISKDEAKFVFEKGCERLIAGSGQMGNVTLSPEAEAYFSKKGCKVILQPTPEDEMTEPSETHPASYWHKLDDDRIQCDLCPRFCRLHEGQRAFCFVRARHGGEMVLTSYGRSSGFCIDPVEKKPLNHFLPGTPVLSFGTSGCNLGCKFCQNWDISKAREFDVLARRADPEQIAAAAQRLGAPSVACTYNDPTIFHEYAINTAIACRERSIKSIAVTAGYVCPEPRAEFYRHMDAANIDLKGFTEDFYHKVCYGHLQAVLDTLVYVKRETSVWLEITTLLIPGLNDSDAELERMTQWVAEHLGPDVPWHFTAFHPDWRMRDIPSTDAGTLSRARTIALKNGIRYAFPGNVYDPAGQATYCHNCRALLIGRGQYEITAWKLAEGKCRKCGTPCAGIFERSPGTWGSKRTPVMLEAGADAAC